MYIKTRFKISGDLISEILSCPPEMNGLSLNYLVGDKPPLSLPKIITVGRNYKWPRLAQ